MCDRPLEDARADLFALARRNPVFAILDSASVDAIAPLLDVSFLELLFWPEGRETLMQALQQLQLSERASEQLRREGQVDIDGLRTEVERIARTLSALVEHPAPPQPVSTGRTPAESGRMLRDIVRKRRARANFFPAELFADPAWDILLDLAAARHEGMPVSVSSLCIASAVPTTTALRWIKALTEAQLLQRVPDPDDGRRSFVSLTEQSAESMERYLDIAG
ncbi:MAG: winged helix DNA-binding protein [Pseudomonadota bacterium]